MRDTHDIEAPASLPTGPGAAAILAAGIGCAVLGVFAVFGNEFNGIAWFFEFYTPVGPLSGVTSCALAVWLASWFFLAKTWADRDIAIGPVSAAAFVLLAIGFALTFPPVVNLLHGA
jgi:hypothetical protein